MDGTTQKGSGDDSEEPDPGAVNRGLPASAGSGPVTGSGSGAGGGGAPEDFDSDQAGQGRSTLGDIEDR